MERRQFLEGVGGAGLALLFGNACGDTASDSANDSGMEGGGSTGNATSGEATSGGTMGATSSSGGAADDGNGVSSGTTGGQQDSGMMGDAGSKDAGSMMGAACAAKIVAQIRCRHGHSLEIPVADLMAGAQKTYDIAGTAGHSHKVIVAESDFAKLKRGETVQIFVPTAPQFQDHDVYLSCAANWNPAARDNEGTCK